MKIFMFFIVFQFSFAFTIYPKQIKKNIAKNTSEVFTIINTFNENYIVKVEINFSNPHITTQIYPKVFILNSKSKKLIKISLKNNKNIKNGIHKGYLKFTLIPTHLKDFDNLIIELYINAEVYTQI